jgi:molybdenum cofactor cytidylyltransferase
MPPPDSPFVTGLVLAAGGSRRLGQPKQLLRYGDATLLDAVLAVARRAAFDQLLCVIGGAAARIRENVDLSRVEVVVNPAFGRGCSSSIAAGLRAVDLQADVLVLMLGDQPGVNVAAVRAVAVGLGTAPIACCRYDDGRGHPMSFSNALFDELSTLHGDKAVWKLMDRYAADVVEVPVAGPVPLDVDTWADYEAVLAAR